MTELDPTTELDPRFSDPKYGRIFVYEVRDGVFRTEGTEDEVLAYEVRATKAFGFGKGETFRQTRYRF